MNALEIHNSINAYAKENSASFKEVLKELKQIQDAIKLVKVRSGLIETIVLETANDWPTVSLTVQEFLSIIKGTNKKLEKEKLLHTDAEIKELSIKFEDSSVRTYTSRLTSSSRFPSEEICSNINYLVQNKFDTAW